MKIAQTLAKIGLCAALILSPTISRAQEDPLADVKKQLVDQTKPFTFIVEFKAKAESKKEFMKLAREAVKNTRKEPGNHAYSVHGDAKDPNTIVFFEIWASMEALESHVKQEYTKALLGSVETLCEGKPNIRVLLPLAAPLGKPKAPEAPATPAPATK
jgi:quinol monooxygenase YgiN